MNKVYLSYYQTKSGGFPLSDEDYCDREPEVINFTPRGLYVQEGNSQETIDVKFDPSLFIDKPIYMIYARYRTGDTFGYTTGEWAIVDVVTDEEEAEKIAENIRNDDSEDYRPWKGYFEELEYVAVWRTILIDKKCPGFSLF